MSDVGEIVIGDLSDALDRIASIGGGQMLPLVTDARLLALHGAKLAPVTLQPPILIPEGEAATIFSRNHCCSWSRTRSARRSALSSL